MELDFARPGKPTDNDFIKAFNGRFRQECLNENWFLSLADVEEKVDLNGDIAMAKGPTALWGTCPRGSLPHWQKYQIDPQNSHFAWISLWGAGPSLEQPAKMSGSKSQQK